MLLEKTGKGACHVYLFSKHDKDKKQTENNKVATITGLRKWIFGEHLFDPFTYDQRKKLDDVQFELHVEALNKSYERNHYPKPAQTLFSELHNFNVVLDNGLLSVNKELQQEMILEIDALKNKIINMEGC